MPENSRTSYEDHAVSIRHVGCSCGVRHRVRQRPACSRCDRAPSRHDLETTMKLERFALAAAFSAITALAWSTEAQAASAETYHLSNVTQNWQSIGLSAAA